MRCSDWRSDGCSSDLHDIDRTPIDPSHVLDQALARLEGRKLIFTNGSVRHAERVLEKIGIARHFSDITDIVAGDYIPKPNRETYERMIERFRIDPAKRSEATGVGKEEVKR